MISSFHTETDRNGTMDVGFSPRRYVHRFPVLPVDLSPVPGFLVRYRVLLILLLISGIQSCTKYPEFRRAGSGIYYQLLEIGEDTVSIQPGDYITAGLTYQTMNDSVFFSGTRKFQVENPSFKGAVDACFLMLSNEDKATFILDADGFFNRTLQTSLPDFLGEDHLMKITVDVLEVQKEREYLQEKTAFLEWIEDFGEYERIVLEQYIAEEELQVKPMPNGIYYLQIQPGKGDLVSPGDTLTLHYEGRFLNGRFFDSTVRRNQPFQFVYGTEWQVIKGLEEAIGMMREGERSLFIIPSDLAFGMTGSSTGIIPPYTSLIFEVEILAISSPNENQ